MKYPSHTISKPLVGSAAKKVVSAVREGKVLSNRDAKATAARIAKLVGRQTK